jgi:hypothetical protein
MNKSTIKNSLLITHHSFFSHIIESEKETIYTSYCYFVFVPCFNELDCLLEFRFME